MEAFIGRVRRQGRLQVLLRFLDAPASTSR